MKILITEEQLNLIISEEGETEYTPIPKEKVDAYKELTNYAKSKGLDIKQKDEYKNYPNQKEELSDNPFDYNELVSGAVSHNQFNNKDFGDKIGSTPFSHRKNKDNDITIDELGNLKQLIDIVAQVQKHGIKINRLTGGDDYYHRKSRGNHPRTKSLDFTISDDTEETHKKLEEIIGKLIAKHSFLFNNLVFANEYYFGSPDKKGKHIHLTISPEAGDPSKFQFLTDKEGKRIGKTKHQKANRKIKEKYEGKEIVFDDVFVRKGAGSIPLFISDVKIVNKGGKSLLKFKIGDENTQDEYETYVRFRVYDSNGNPIKTNKLESGVFVDTPEENRAHDSLGALYRKIKKGNHSYNITNMIPKDIAEKYDSFYLYFDNKENEDVVEKFGPFMVVDKIYTGSPEEDTNPQAPFNYELKDLTDPSYKAIQDTTDPKKLGIIPPKELKLPNYKKGGN